MLLYPTYIPVNVNFTSCHELKAQPKTTSGSNITNQILMAPQSRFLPVGPLYDAIVTQYALRSSGGYRTC